MPDPDPLLQLVMSATVPHAALRALCEILLNIVGEQIDISLLLQGELSAERQRLLEAKLPHLQDQPGVTMRTPLLRELRLRPEEEPPASGRGEDVPYGR